MRTPDSFKEQRGFFTFVQNTKDTNYLELAYVQCMSIKLTQQTSKYAIAIDAATREQLRDVHFEAFDYIIDIPDDEAVNDTWKLANEWKAWWLTPFKETIKLDCDVLFPKSIDHWWDMLCRKEVFFTSQVMMYDGNIATDRSYRKLFDDNHLPDVYSGLFYFRFGQESLQFFECARTIFYNWDYIKSHVLKNCRDPKPTTDVVYGLAASILGEEKFIIPGASYPTFVHMKPALHKWGISDKWHKKVYGDIDGTDILIGFTKQMYPVHYHEKEFVTEEIINHYEQQFKQLRSEESSS